MVREKLVIFQSLSRFIHLIAWDDEMKNFVCPFLKMDGLLELESCVRI